MSEQRAQLEKNGIGPNAMLLVGHGTVRRRVMGDDVQRPARPDEIARMRTLVREQLQQGAVGMSAGLEYEPGRWSTTDEVVELARELPAVNGVYISHERSEGSDPLWYVPSQDGPSAPTLLDAPQQFSVTFPSAGTFRYYCGAHGSNPSSGTVSGRSTLESNRPP